MLKLWRRRRDMASSLPPGSLETQLVHLIKLQSILSENIKTTSNIAIVVYNCYAQQLIIDECQTQVFKGFRHKKELIETRKRTYLNHT